MTVVSGSDGALPSMESTWKKPPDSGGFFDPRVEKTAAPLLDIGGSLC
jgi:hypothetical protein